MDGPMEATGTPQEISKRYLKNVAAWSEEPRAAVVMTDGLAAENSLAISAKTGASFSSRVATTCGASPASFSIRDWVSLIGHLQFSIRQRNHRRRRDNAIGCIQRRAGLPDAKRVRSAAPAHRI